ncbi:MAG: hypothetical protein H7195_06665 [Chryseobacterium sp.]|nr:hypothetical protein [Chryseobacterium sp.]
MTTETQKTEIRDYLLSKKLPIDILLEVNDHFVSQISDLEKEENLSFKDTFEKTKENWKKDLTFSKPFYKIGNAGIPTTNFERKFKREANYNIFKITFLIFIAFIFLLSIILLNVNYKVFNNSVKGFLITSIILCYGSIIFNWIYVYLNFKNTLKDYKVSVFQWHIFMVFSLGYFGLAYLNPMQAWTNEIFNHHLFFVTFLKLTIYFILIFSYIFTAINQLKYAKILRKIKPHLKFV